MSMASFYCRSFVIVLVFVLYLLHKQITFRSRSNRVEIRGAFRIDHTFENSVPNQSKSSENSINPTEFPYSKPKGPASVDNIFVSPLSQTPTWSVPQIVGVSFGGLIFVVDRSRVERRRAGAFAIPQCEANGQPQHIPKKASFVANKFLLARSIRYIR